MNENTMSIIQPTALLVTPDTRALVDAFLAGRSPRTIAAYKQDWADFARFVGAETMDDAAQILLGSGPGAANMAALQYRNHLHERGMAAATINRRLAALRSLVALANTIGMATFALKVPGVKSQPYRDTRGPGDDGFLRMLAVVEGRGDAKGVRDAAILHLLHDLALRRGEVVSLDRVHLDINRGTLAILGKGRTGRDLLTIPATTKQALQAWLSVRGDGQGPLFLNYDRAGKGDRLGESGVYRMVRHVGGEAGLKTWPHGLRHLGITHAITATGGNIAKVQQFSRHKDVRTVMIYNDAGANHQGEVAALVAGFAKPAPVRQRARRRAE